MNLNLESCPLDQSLACARAWLAGKQVQKKPSHLSYLSSKEGQTLLGRFHLPLANQYIETLVRQTVKLSFEERLTQLHLQEAIVSALIHPLRQVIGSCFATAPAIYIQNEKPDQLLIDLFDLMTSAKMKRTMQGNEYVVPISLKWGNRKGDHPLLRVWEYTIASFTDYKKTFSQWNLFSSLGLNPEQEGGIGHFLYTRLEKRFVQFKEKLSALDQTYQEAIDVVRVSQVLLRQADSPEKARMRRAELQVHAHHAEMCKEMRSSAYERSQALLDLFPFLIDQYTKKIEENFAEIFDPEISTHKKSLYGDSPAGFRLVYKHGRADPRAWTFLHNQKEFVESLRHFFLMAEPQILIECASEEEKKEIETLTNELLHFIETETFQTFALKNKTPWSYSSGGSLHTLVKGYFRIEGEIEEEKRCVISPLDLLTFILDVLKSLPYSFMQTFEKWPNRSLFMYSPSHAFLLKPGLYPFKEGWLDQGFTYTWIRDTIVAPMQTHYTSITIDQKTQASLGYRLIQKQIDPAPFSLSLPEFRNQLIKKAPHLEEVIDSFLYAYFSIRPPLLFADSNWADTAFGFAVNPATFELDLYRCKTNEARACPMHPWRSYLNGTSPKHWGILTRPDTYGHPSFSALPFTLKKV